MRVCGVCVCVCVCVCVLACMRAALSACVCVHAHQIYVLSFCVCMDHIAGHIPGSSFGPCCMHQPGIEPGSHTSCCPTNIGPHQTGLIVCVRQRGCQGHGGPSCVGVPPVELGSPEPGRACLWLVRIELASSCVSFSPLWGLAAQSLAGHACGW